MILVNFSLNEVDLVDIIFTKIIFKIEQEIDNVNNNTVKRLLKGVIFTFFEITIPIIIKR